MHLRRSVLVLAIGAGALLLAACATGPAPSGGALSGSARGGGSRLSAPALPEILAQATTKAMPVPTVAPPRATPLPASSTDLERVIKNRKILVGSSLDYPPFSSYDHRYRPDGFDVALMKEIAERMDVRVEFNDFAFEGLGGALVLGQVDAAIAALDVTPARLSLVDFTNPYFTGLDAVLAKPGSKLAIASIEDLADKRTGVQRGTVYETWVRENLIDTGMMTRSNLQVYSRPEDAVRDLGTGRIDVVLMDRQPALNFEKQGSAKIVGQGLNPQTYAIAVRKGSSLVPELNRVLVELQQDGTINDLINEYLFDSGTWGAGGGSGGLLPVPTLIPTITPQPTLIATPTPIPCIDGMAWVADLNLDDNNMKSPPEMKPGTPFTKKWRVRNSGNCDWQPNYTLGYVTGNVPAAKMGGQPVQVGRQVAPGATHDFSVNLVAPQAPGVYQGFWQMSNAQKIPFGERVWVGIKVPAPPTPKPPPTQTPAPGIQFTVDRSVINQGECVNFSWNVTNVKAVYFYPQGQPYQGYGVPGQSGKQVCPASTTTYELRVEKNDGSVEVRQQQIIVNAVQGAPVIQWFGLSPESEIAQGQCVNINWNVTGSVSRVAVVRDGTPLIDYGPVQGSQQDCPPGSGYKTYELQAWGPGGFVKQSRGLNVKPNVVPPTAVPPPPQSMPEIKWISASPQVMTGTCAWVSWEIGANVAYARLYKNNALYGDNAQQFTNIAAFSGNPNGDCDTQPPSITYRLEAFSGSGQSTSKQAVTQVSEAQPR